jgi:hypothetical protein
MGRPSQGRQQAERTLEGEGERFWPARKRKCFPRAAAQAPPKRRGKSNAEHLAAVRVWLRSGLLGCGRWLLTTALPAARRCAWLLLVLLGAGQREGRSPERSQGGLRIGRASGGCD